MKGQNTTYLCIIYIAYVTDLNVTNLNVTNLNIKSYPDQFSNLTSVEQVTEVGNFFSFAN